MTDSKPGLDHREAADIPTEQGGLPNEQTPQGQPLPENQALQDTEDAALLISGVNTGPRREERDSLSPTEERARLSIRAEQDDDEPAGPGPAAGLDRGD